MTTTPKHCADCGSLFDAQTISVLGVTITGERCNACDDEREAAWQARKVELAEMSDQPKAIDRAEQFRRIATESGFRRYLDYDPAKAAMPSVVMRLGDKQGMLFVGPTGKGKTFMAVDLIRRGFLAGKSIALIDAIEFGLAVATPDGERRERELKRAIEADWLLVDDFAKGVLSPRAAEAWFHVANRRENFERPTIWTTNATGEEILQRLPVEIGEPFLERLTRTTDLFRF